MTDLLVLNMDRSIAKSAPVTDLIATATPKTLSIGVLEFLIGLAISIPAGIVSATRKHEPEDYAATIFAFLGLSMPTFFIGILLSVVFGVWLEVLLIFGYTPRARESSPGWRASSCRESRSGCRTRPS